MCEINISYSYFYFCLLSKETVLELRILHNLDVFTLRELKQSALNLLEEGEASKERTSPLGKERGDLGLVQCYSFSISVKDD